MEQFMSAIYNQPDMISLCCDRLQTTNSHITEATALKFLVDYMKKEGEKERRQDDWMVNRAKSPVTRRHCRLGSLQQSL